MNEEKLEQLLTHLPQTQCQLCEHQGCRPYAEAILSGNDDISKCQPGGLETLHGLAKVMNLDPQPWEQKVQTQFKAPSRVAIDPDLCIGCTKCIQACPVDAIIGRSKAMHGVIDSECTGCDLCIPACPMDCIESVARPQPSKAQQQIEQHHFRQRHEQRNERLAKAHQQTKTKHQQQRLDILSKLQELQATKPSSD